MGAPVRRILIQRYPDNLLQAFQMGLLSLLRCQVELVLLLTFLLVLFLLQRQSVQIANTF